MYALILAAGRGERLRPLTDSTPKPLLRVGPHALIEHHLFALSMAGITNIVVNHAHLGQQIVSTLGDGSRYGVNIEYSAEPEGALETAGGIRKALPLLQSDPFAVVNGDIWTDYPFGRLLRPISRQAHIVLVDNPGHHPAGDFKLFENQVTEIDRNLPGKALTFSGIGIYRRELFEDLSPVRAPLAPILRAVMGRNGVTGEHHFGRWIDVGTPLRLAELDAELSRVE